MEQIIKLIWFSDRSPKRGHPGLVKNPQKNGTDHKSSCRQKWNKSNKMSINSLKYTNKRITETERNSQGMSCIESTKCLL